VTTRPTFVVAAGTGAVLYRHSLVAHDAEGEVYENFPGAPQGGTQTTKSFGPTPQSPAGYTDPTGLAGIAGPTTFGNNPNTYANYPNFLVRADQAPRPVSPTGQFDYPYEMNWQKTNRATVPPSYALDPTRPRRTSSGSTTASTTSTTTTASPRPPATSR
jgi:extracellular elastinolytic metalloproteinase